MHAEKKRTRESSGMRVGLSLVLFQIARRIVLCRGFCLKVYCLAAAAAKWLLQV